MSEGYSRRTVLRGVAGGASALALPAGPATDPGAGPDPAAVADGVPGAGRAALSDHDRAAFLAAQDPVWARMPRTWYEGPFLGNGFLGSILYAEPAANGLRFTVQHSEVQDHRPQIQGNDWGVARLPVGHLTLEPVGQITGVQLRLHLWDAEVRGTITTDKGHIRLRALVQNDRSLLLVTARPSRGERDFRWVFHSEKALSPRIVREPPPPALVPNPDRVPGDHRAWRTGAVPDRRAHLPGDQRAAEGPRDRRPRHRRRRPVPRRHPPRLVARVLPQELPVSARRDAAELLLDPALQSRRRRAPRGAGHGDHRPVAGTYAVAGRVVEPQRAAGVLAHPRLQPPGAGRDPPHAHRQPADPHQRAAAGVPR